MKTFAIRFDSAHTYLINVMVKWCEQNLFQGGYYEPNWHYQYNTFYFVDEKEYLMFVLRWA